MLDGRLHIGHSHVHVETEFGVVSLILLVYHFVFNKIIFSIFQVSSDRERSLTAFVRHLTLCGILLEKLFSCTGRVLQLHV